MDLFEAVCEGNADRVKELLETGQADIDATDEDGFNALHHAVKRNDINIVTILCEHRADVNKLTSFGRFRSPLYIAVAAGHFDIVKFLVQKRADVDQATDSDRWYKEKGETPLHRAAYKGRLDIAEFLVSEGASINVTDGDGWTPLHCASYLGRHDIAEFLITAGADVNEKDSEGLTPLNCASERGNVDIISFLCQKGADVQERDTEGLTPLHHASERGHLKTVTYLLEKGANINEADPDGGTPLHYACRWGHLKTADLLVEKGADVRLGDKDGETATHHATRKGNHDILTILLDRGAEVNQQTMDGSTPLHVASVMGHSDALRFFLRRGAKLDLQNDKGETPLDCASDSQMRRIMQRFQKDGVILEDEEVLDEDAKDSESGGEPELEEFYKVARSVQKVSDFWSLFTELGVDNATVANILPIREAIFKVARQILQTWSDNTPGKISEKKKALKKIPEYEMLTSSKGLSYGDILGQISRLILSVTQLINLASTLGFSAADVMLRIDGTSSIAEREKLFDSCVYLLSQWVKDGGQRDTLLQVLQKLHLTEPAEAVSSAIQEQPDQAENFSFSAIDQEGGEIKVGEGDVQITLPPGSLPDDSCEVVTIKVPEHIQEIPQDLVEEEEIQASPPVQCSPSGLKFNQPVKITVPHCTSLDKITSKTEVILYTKDDKGKFERDVLKPKDYKITKDAVVVNVNHFSSFFVSMKNAGFKLGLLPFHPVKMPSNRKPILEVYVYKNYKRNEKKILNKFKKLKKKFKRATDAFELLMEGGHEEDITIFCPSSSREKEHKISYSKIKSLKSNRVTFELDFSREMIGTQNIELMWKQGSGEMERQMIQAEMDDPDEQVQRTMPQQRAPFSEEYDIPPGFEPILMKISDGLGDDEVLRLGVKLDLTATQVRRYQDTNHKGSVVTTTGTFYMLCYWCTREMTNKNPKVVETLRDALISSDLVQVVEECLSDIIDEPRAEVNEGDSNDSQRPHYARVDSMTNELADRPMWASMVGAVNSKYRAAYSLSRASSKNFSN